VAGGRDITAAAAEPVVLVHGLWSNRAAMLYLARALAARGFAPRALGYASTLHGFEASAARIGQALARTPGARLHVVAHSLGALVVLRALAREPNPRVHRVVLLGAPVRGCLAGRTLACRRWAAPLLGATRSFWLDLPPLAIPPGVEAGAIAGTRPLGLGQLVLRVPGPSDGVVRVDETRDARLADHLPLPVAHSQMLVSSRVADAAAAFLRTGRFAR
jgi:pimeloyl-ACP methyl ester carboxylesterase